MFDQLHDSLIKQAFTEGFINGKHVAVDATHVEARDAANPAKKRSRKKKNTVNPNQVELAIDSPTAEAPRAKPIQPKKRGRKSKAEREQWLVEQAEIEAAKTIMEKTLDQLLDHTCEEIMAEVPTAPSWGTKKNTDNKKIFWFGYHPSLLPTVS